jgi:hypothetical protein
MLPAAAPPKMPPEQDMVAEKWNWVQKPGNTNNPHGAMGSTKQGLLCGETKQSPPDIAPAVRPPSDQDQDKRRYGYTLKGYEKH